MSFIQREMPEPKQLPMCDLRRMRDPQAVVEVVHHCLQNMLATETQHIASPGITRNQREITERMRENLISWCIQVNMKFKQLPETLYISVNLIDRYTELCPVPRNEYQLLAVTAMFVAGKYQDVNTPCVEQFTAITDNTYTHDQVLAYEQKLLTVLAFDLTFSTSYTFLERFIQLSNVDMDNETE